MLIFCRIWVGEEGMLRLVFLMGVVFGLYNGGEKIFLKENRDVFMKEEWMLVSFILF